MTTPTPTRLAIEAAMQAIQDADGGRAQLAAIEGYERTTSLNKMRQLLQEHDTEVVQLKAGLAAANTNAEKFEREWYLRGDELEAEKERNGLCRELLSRMAYALNSTRLIMTDKAGRDYVKELCDEAAAALKQGQTK